MSARRQFRSGKNHRNSAKRDSDSAFTFNCRLWFRLRSWFPAGNAFSRMALITPIHGPNLGRLPAAPAGSPAARNTAASCARSRVRSQTPAPPHARSYLPPTRPANTSIDLHGVHSLRCPTNLALSTTIRETKIRRSTFPPPHHPLSRRDAVYFRSGVTFAHKQKHFPLPKSRNVLKKTSSYSELRKVG